MFGLFRKKKEEKIPIKAASKDSAGVTSAPSPSKQPSERERLDMAMSRLAQGEEYCLSWVYTFLPSQDKKIVRDAAISVA